MNRPQNSYSSSHKPILGDQANCSIVNPNQLAISIFHDLLKDDQPNHFCTSPNSSKILIHIVFILYYRRWTMKSNPCCIIVNPRTPKFQCCLWAARLGPVDKNIKPWTQRKLGRVLCNIEIWGVGFYLVDVCGVWFFCPSTVIPYIYNST